MLGALTLIFTCQLIGETTTRALDLPLPGPVAGMVLLFIYLAVRGGISADMSRVADGLLSHLALLFVPAGVGVMLHFRLLGEEWLPIAVALIASTALTIAVTAWVMHLLTRKSGDQPDG
ncbi:CidA/LrgA family protein [Actibacterium pelagium]|uniref:Murein hydrolase transporter LrgA n=1 Tax=Actibacterium pelagium TaxID=2029103 RepID=A0A917ABU5_9RHOB|nr:CidA/LrgA family protein [Actibacterium pelagium]GGE39978.1 murein hydrolase transporter LrgA [Actibacterium pelagium]